MSVRRMAMFSVGHGSGAACLLQDKGPPGRVTLSGWRVEFYRSSPDVRAVFLFVLLAIILGLYRNTQTLPSQFLDQPGRREMHRITLNPLRR